VLTKTPKNVVVEAGTNVTLECATSGSANPMMWTYDASIVVTLPCRSENPRFIATSVPNGCFLTALGNYNIQGPYGCEDNDPRSKSVQALVIVVGKIALLRVKQQLPGTTVFFHMPYS